MKKSPMNDTSYLADENQTHLNKHWYLKCEKVPMNETNYSEIDLDDPNQNEYKYLRTTAALIIEGVLLPILATFGIVGKSVN